MGVKFKCGKCLKPVIDVPYKVPLYVITEEPFWAARICDDCINYLNDHGLHLLTIEEYTKKNGGQQIMNFIYAYCKGCGHPIYSAQDARIYNDRYFCPTCYEIERRRPFQQLELFNGGKHG